MPDSRRPTRLGLRIAAAALAWALGAPVALAVNEPPVLRVSLENEPVSLDWNRSISLSDRYLVSFLMRGMLKYDAKGGPVCDLCKTYSVSEDGRTYRFELAPDEVWSDGEKLDPSHFVDSFRRLLNPANGFRTAGDFKVIAGAAQPGKGWDPKKLEVRADGKSSLVMVLAEPSAAFLHLLTRTDSFPVRKAFAKGAADSAKDAGVAMASGPVLGPYQLAAWERGKRIVIEGNPSYGGARPVYRVDFFLGKHGFQAGRFKAGKLDILANPTTEDLMALPGQNLQISPYWATRNLLFNLRRKPVAEPALRRAILLSLDRDSLPSFLKNGERPVSGLIPPGMPGYRDLALATQDLTRAQAERQRVADGAAELGLLIRDNDTERAVAQWLAERLAKIRLKLKVQAGSGADYFRKLDAGDFDLALTTWSFSIASPIELLNAFETGASANKGSWTNVGYDALYSELVRERRPAEHAALVDRCTQLLEVQDVAVIPLGYPTQPFLLGSRVISFAMTPFGYPDLVRIKLKQ